MLFHSSLRKELARSFGATLVVLVRRIRDLVQSDAGPSASGECPSDLSGACISDKSGEDEVWLVAQDGSRPAEQLTTGGKAQRYAPEWSADGKFIAFSDKDGKLYTVSLSDKKLTEVADSKRGQILDYTWSPKGNFLAFSMPDEQNLSSVYIWSTKENSLQRVTGLQFSESNPAWDPKGNYLYYLSTREFAPLIGTSEFNYATTRDTGIFVLSLRKDVKHPFPPESDEVAITTESKKPEEAKPAPEFTIDFDGIEHRTAKVPVEANNYLGLSANGGNLIYAVGPSFYYGRSGDGPPTLRIFSLKDRKESQLAEGIGGFSLSADGSKILVRMGPGFALMDATPGGDKSRKPVSTAGLFVDRVPEEEWRQIFNEVWRRYRDWFYVPNMHGYDWEAIRKQYEPLLKYVAHRSDLNYVISEMISELTVQHARPQE